MINNRICRDYWLPMAKTVYREQQQHFISVWHCWKCDYMYHKLAIKAYEWVLRVADIDQPSELSADTTCSFCAVNPSLCRCNGSPAVYPAEWSCTLGGCVTDSRPSCLAGLVGGHSQHVHTSLEERECFPFTLTTAQTTSPTNKQNTRRGPQAGRSRTHFKCSVQEALVLCLRVCTYRQTCACTTGSEWVLTGGCDFLGIVGVNP